MRLWSLHPSYLDAKGLVALWREGLLALKVFARLLPSPPVNPVSGAKDPEAAIEAYLWGVYEESLQRGYHFDAGKLSAKPQKVKKRVTAGQLEYELNHLLRKLKRRDVERYKTMTAVKTPPAHPLFRIVPGNVEKWEWVE